MFAGKGFSDTPPSDEAYNATTWDGKTGQAPSKNAIRDKLNSMDTSIGLLAPIASPTFTGDPKAPTPADNDSDTSLATTAFAKSQDAVLAREPDQGVAMTAATSGSTGITVADSVHIDHGTGAGFISCERTLASWTAAAILMEKHDDTTGYRLSVVVTTGYIKLELNDTTYTSTAAPGFAANTKHKITATWSPGATNTTVAFYADGVAFGAPAAQANETTTDNAAAFYAMGTDAVRTAGIDGGDIVGNFAPTAAEVLDLYRNGIPESWKWGSQTSKVVTPFANVSIVPYQYDTLDGASIYGFHAVDDGSGDIAQAVGTKEIVLKKGHQYKTTWNVTLTSGEIPYLILRTNYGSGTVHFDVANTVTTTQNIFTATEDATAIFYWQNLIATEFTVSNFSIIELGATLALLPENIQNDKWYDASSNGLNATYPTTGWSLTRPVTKKRIKQPTPTAETTAVTLTIAKLLTGIITATHAAGATQAYTLPTGAFCDAWPAFGIDDYFDWVLINLSAAAADTVTVTADTGHTIVGNPIVQSAHSSTGGIYGNSATFRTRKTAASTFVSYRIN